MGAAACLASRPRCLWRHPVPSLSSVALARAASPTTLESALSRRASSSMQDKAADDYFLEVLQSKEARRVNDVVDAAQAAMLANYVERNHHVNRHIQGERGPNALGVHLPYYARQGYHRGSRGRWGLARRSVGRLGWLEKSANF